MEVALLTLEQLMALLTLRLLRLAQPPGQVLSRLTPMLPTQHSLIGLQAMTPALACDHLQMAPLTLTRPMAPLTL